MEELKVKVNIAYVSSEMYSKYAYISMISLFENNKDINEILIYFIEDNIHENTKKQLIELCEYYNRNIKFISALEIYKSIVNIKSVTTHHKSLNIYASLFLTKIEDIDRILLIECDVIVNGPIIDLYKTDLENNYMSGLYMMFPAKYNIYDKNHPWYINGGIILFDLKKMREVESETNIIRYFEKSEGYESAETALYSLYMDKILPMDPKYHLIPEMLFFNQKQREVLNSSKEYYSNTIIETAIKNPVMIHYANSFYGRPWQKKCTHPLKNVYLNYMELSPWKGMLEDGDIDLKTKLTKYIFRLIPFSLFLLFRNLIIKKSKQ